MVLGNSEFGWGLIGVAIGSAILALAFVIFMPHTDSPNDARRRIFARKQAGQQGAEAHLDFGRLQAAEAIGNARLAEIGGWVFCVLAGNTTGVALATSRSDKLRKLAEQYAILSASEWRHSDPRPPVVYHRSFGDESHSAFKGGQKQITHDVTYQDLTPCPFS